MKNDINILPQLLDKYLQFKVMELSGRYINFSHIEPLVKKENSPFHIEEIGISTNGIPIHLISAGNGPLKILAWSQMHGNESTTTKAIFDILNAIDLFPDDPAVKLISEKITLKVIPMLNPDGALKYTRENANQTDLNRDALRLKEVESKLLRKTFIDFDPDFCLNLHDQRTIFSAGHTPKPATLSFLTPAMNEKREIFPERLVSMQIIAAIVEDLNPMLAGQIGRYNDEFNPNCTGDTFQSLGKPTILFEAGHFPNDYQREISRQYVVAAILSSLMTIATGNWKKFNEEYYFAIPENNKLFYDVILRRCLVKENVQDIAIQYQERLVKGEIIFQPVIEKVETALSFYGHKEIECNEQQVIINDGKQVAENVVVNKLLLKNEVLAINYQNI